MLFLALVLTASSPLEVHSEPVVDARSAREAVASAHCAVLQVAAHPKRALALASRICLRPEPTPPVVEERGVVDLRARRFTFVRVPFRPREPFQMPFDDRCTSDVEAAGASDWVSRALRSREGARCLFEAAHESVDHPLWSWFDPDANHPIVSWSGAGRRHRDAPRVRRRSAQRAVACRVRERPPLWALRPVRPRHPRPVDDATAGGLAPAARRGEECCGW